MTLITADRFSMVKTSGIAESVIAEWTYLRAKKFNVPRGASVFVLFPPARAGGCSRLFLAEEIEEIIQHP